MHFGSILVLAIGLAMDAAAAAASSGLAVERVRPRHVLAVAVVFGGCQALMPAIGWAVGEQVGPWIADWDHWVVFALLLGIGGHMLWEAPAPDAARRASGDPFALRRLLVLGIATSIDALAAGLSLPLLDAPLLLSIGVIGVVTALLSVLGLFAGRRCGALLGRRLDTVGGLVLIGLGVKVLVQHLSE